MKPLNKKNYGSIPHLIGSKLGGTDKYVHQGQHDILTKKTRDKHDYVIVDEKYDGSNVGIAKKDGKIITLTRSGYLANTSPYKQHIHFDNWVKRQVKRFEFIGEGERLVGEWLLQVHSLEYEITQDPFIAFDYYTSDNKRIQRSELIRKTNPSEIETPRNIFHGYSAFPIDASMDIVRRDKYCHSVICKDKPEGVVYRVERKGVFDFAAKFVREDFEPGKYAIGIEEGSEIWNELK